MVYVELLLSLYYMNYSEGIKGMNVEETNGITNNADKNNLKLLAVRPRVRSRSTSSRVSLYVVDTSETNNAWDTFCVFQSRCMRLSCQLGSTTRILLMCKTCSLFY